MGTRSLWSKGVNTSWEGQGTPHRQSIIWKTLSTRALMPTLPSCTSGSIVPPNRGVWKYGRKASLRELPEK